MLQQLRLLQPEWSSKIVMLYQQSLQLLLRQKAKISDFRKNMTDQVPYNNNCSILLKVVYLSLTTVSLNS